VLLAKIGIAIQALWITMSRLSHHLGISPARLDERRDAFVAGVVKPKVIKPATVPRAVERRLQSVRRDWKDPAI